MAKFIKVSHCLSLNLHPSDAHLPMLVMHCIILYPQYICYTIEAMANALVNNASSLGPIPTPQQTIQACQWRKLLDLWCISTHGGKCIVFLVVGRGGEAGSIQGSIAARMPSHTPYQSPVRSTLAR